MTDERLEKLRAVVLSTSKYRHIHPELVARIGAAELNKGRNLKEAVKETKNKLHQIGGAYFPQTPQYAAWLSQLQRAARSEEALKTACREVMRFHNSTRERLPILEEFFATTLGKLAPVESVLDIACGLNPLAIPWMPVAEGASYLTCDIYQDLADFLDSAFTQLPVRGKAWVCDVLEAVPAQKVQLALLLKSIPCLEQVDKNIGARLLESLQAEHILVSFPARSLGGRKKGMVENYEAHFLELVKDQPWRIERFEFKSELAFLVRK